MRQLQGWALVCPVFHSPWWQQSQLASSLLLPQGILGVVWLRLPAS